MVTVREAKAAGADTVLFADTKASNFWALDYRDRWLTKMIELRDAIRAEGMKLVVTTASVGYCAPILGIDPSIVSSIQTVDMPLVVRGDELVAEQTAQLANGSFEQSESANVPAQWGFQDGAGSVTFVDTQTAADGEASMRFDATAASQGTGMARISTNAAVQPNQQYLLRYRLKADALNAGFIGPVVRGGDTEITLTNQHPSFQNAGGGRTYSQGANNLTTEWVDIELSFNSREFTSVNLFFGVWSGRSGTAWIDDVRIEPAPTLNIVRRDSLPLTLRTETGTVVSEGIDVAPISDPQLGEIGYTGNFDTYHDAPAIRLADGSSLSEGDRVLLTGWHAQLTASGQTGCAWHEPRTFELMEEMHRQVASLIEPDGILIDVEETRTGGWEPADSEFGSSGAAFGAHVQRVLTEATAVVDGTPLFIWNDMIDPTMNATADFYQVRGTLENSWQGIDPSLVTIVNWRAGDELYESGRDGVNHFADLGFQQVVAGFYDEDVATNHAAWAAAIDGQPGIVGSMYTTWEDDFSQLDAFAALWWRS
jgi:hypothetical protein